MEMTSLKRKPRKCPACGSLRVASILYGYPAYSEELKRKIELGRIVLVGVIFKCAILCGNVQSSLICPARRFSGISPHLVQR